MTDYFQLACSITKQYCENLERMEHFANTHNRFVDRCIEITDRTNRKPCDECNGEGRAEYGRASEERTVILPCKKCGGSGQMRPDEYDESGGDD